MTISFLPSLVTLVGLVVYLLPTPAKVAECGRIAFWTGLFFLVSCAANHTWRIQ